MLSLECIVKVKNNIVEVETYNIDFPNLVYFSTKKLVYFFKLELTHAHYIHFNSQFGQCFIIT